MPRSFRSTAVSGIVLAATATLLFFFGRPGVETASAQKLEATGNLHWYKGNMHTHSLWSDGDDYPEMIADWYKTHDYDFLVFTDHNTLLDHERWIDVEKTKGKKVAYDKLKTRFPDGWVKERTVDGRLEVRLKQFPEIVEKLAEPGKYLLIQGEEISDRFVKRPIHMNITNAQKMIPPLGGASVYEAMQNNVNAVIAQREATGKPMLIHLNHPNFGWGITAEDLMRVRGENYFEVYNGHPSVYNSGNADRASTDRIWDIMLAMRITDLNLPLMYGLGTDDGHSYHNIPKVGASNPGRGWVEVLATDLNPKALIEAMEAGRFYASSGVKLSKVTSSSRGLEVEVDSEPGVEYSITFIGTKKGFDPKSEPVLDKAGKEIETTRKYSDDIGKTFATVSGTKGTYQFQPDDLYVRAVITSTKKHPNPSEPDEFERAWAQPVLGPAAPKQE